MADPAKPDGVLNDVVVDRDASAVGTEAPPARRGVSDRLGEIGFLADELEFIAPGLGASMSGPAALRRSSAVRPRMSRSIRESSPMPRRPVPLSRGAHRILTGHGTPRPSKQRLFYEERKVHADQDRDSHDAYEG